MKRTENRKPDKAERTDRNNNPARERRSGEGAASALASLKKLERDRASTKPGDGSKG
jgi:hypothetical protein